MATGPVLSTVHPKAMTSVLFPLLDIIRDQSLDEIRRLPDEIRVSGNFIT